MSTDERVEIDRRFMAAAIRLSERNTGLTGTNPSVATLLVRDDGAGPVIVGRGITAPGGRPHAETEALAEAGALAVGATAYVTLEPCAHHGRTPPCAEALVTARIGRAVSASGDPDDRVDGRGHSILRKAGIALTTRVLAPEAARAMSGYLMRSTARRPEVTLKLAISRDGCIGRAGEGQVAITGPVANRQTHLLRARSDAILVGVGTLKADDPQLTCRLPGLEARSPLRIVLDARLEAPLTAGVVATARHVPTAFAVIGDRPGAGRFREAGCEIIACETDPGSGRIALPELLEDLAARGIATVLVEGGATVARQFLAEDLVDRLILVEGEGEIGAGGLASPIDPHDVPQRFARTRTSRFGRDRWTEYDRRPGA
ncbi:MULTISPECIES: bifunctional diaminohydroxyphosphoribosylaminopyrimidine deaminase/5-amino-6-(5-phosphoribosylamino)uracil reductase RibD [unclassified Aureimonas]|uniref:bifunctional diaminohydroxyphosphoribosylaminopyrimidine deaminase/5-amino-6-(5-phosphoribosylamino)uracil reductase RibD n=1 Tax=unclassified Aureimonas TaxID=2615206 RepID=UPI0007015EEC|nr:MULTISPECIES: bifunctional diaminohydroxyphosphoribosylaminopyrimidine deaminase/5-amino-6-(5-phosphoribosylamino)uracil reductase RibD [unclassified Aureimonas]KQT52966.1 bifunctional diaminohydroxyphosphoribosylaminopyrimidine deaminase/5-amino-6-(5-phosphoribosylamino)uracil reductase [Aureimonas sp. Leaf427]KQT80425.1 bifunctional diaminohydroxyphosphoribosylaminopyrimidine deaminase/5-amino-6-(5-phosphoribosylamino)uracil reductase [Aureimonas sp. Leaf460]